MQPINPVREVAQVSEPSSRPATDQIVVYDEYWSLYVTCDAYE